MIPDLQKMLAEAPKVSLSDERRVFSVRKPKWSVERVKRSFHEVSGSEMAQRLAEIWEILLNTKGQPVEFTKPLLLKPAPMTLHRESPIQFALSKRRRQNVE